MTAAAKLANGSKATDRGRRTCVPARIWESMNPEPVEVTGLNVVANALTASHGLTLAILPTDVMNDTRKKTALMALQMEIRQQDLMANVTGQANESPQVKFDHSREYGPIRQVTQVLKPYHELREATVQAPLAADAEEDSDGDTRGDHKHQWP